MRPAVIASAVSLLLAFPALALEPPDVKGFWTGSSPECGTVNLQINNQRKTVLEGTYQCTKTGTTSKFGMRLIPGQQAAGTIEGSTVVIDGERSTVRLKLDGDKLIGYTSGVGQPRATLALARRK